jgi:HEAT repeat protein/Mg-chelatase subunit ChlD
MVTTEALSPPAGVPVLTARVLTGRALAARALAARALAARALAAGALAARTLTARALTGPALAVLLAASLAAPASAQETVHQAVHRVEQAWRDGITPERMLALEQLARFDSPEAVDGLIDILERGEVAMYPAARRILGGYTLSESVKRLVKRGVSHRDPVVRTQVLLALGESRPAGLDWVALTQKALDDPLPMVRAAAVGLLGRARAAASVERIVALASDPSERVRSEVPGAIVRLAGSRAMPVLDTLARDLRWRVRLAAARALADLRTPEAALRLVEALESETGRLREDEVALLQRLTGRTLGLDSKPWRALLESAPPDLFAQGDAVALAGLAPPRYVTGEHRYYSISTTSLRFVLLTDLSGSMETPVKLPDTEVSEPRLQVTQRELRRLLDSLSPRVAFDLLTFRDDAEAWRRTLVAADERNRRAARSEVDGYSAAGATNLHAAFESVFEMAETAMDSDIARPEDLDTVFLLSDGVATVGTVRDTELLLGYVAERNRTLQLRIHCLSLTSERESRDFLQRLATLAGGHYVELVARD